MTQGTVVLETPRLIFREWLPDDWLRFKPIATDPRVLRYVGTGQVPTDEQIQGYIEAARKQCREDGFCLWPLVYRENGALIGFCGLDHLWGGEEIEIGYWLAPGYWGKGLATEAAHAVLRYGFNRLGLQRIVAVAHPENRASIRVLEKLGMAFEKTVLHEGITHVYHARSSNSAVRVTDASIGVVVRPATIEDAEAISGLVMPLVKKFIAPEFSPVGQRNLLSSMEPAAIRGFFKAGHRYHVAEVEGQMVGVVGIRDNSHVHHLFVVEKFHRRGIGRRLWEIARKECLAAGNLGRFTVFSSRYALEAYRRLGFVEAGPPETKDEVTAVPMKYEQPSSHEGTAMSTNYFDQSAATWDSEPRRIALMKDVGEAILQHAKPTKDMDVLDYGCGTGLVSLFLLPHVKSVTGADNSPGMLVVLKKKIAEGGIANMKVIRLNLEQDPLPNERYHLIVTSMTMHHVADTGRVIQAFHGLLHPGGKVCIADLDTEPGVFHPPEAAGSVHHHGFDRDWLKSQLVAAGFTKMHDITAHTVYKPVDGGGKRGFPVFLITAIR